MSSGAWVVVGAAVGAGLGTLGTILGGGVERAVRARSELRVAAAAWIAATDALAAAAEMDVAFSQHASNRLGRGLEWVVNQIEATLGSGRVELARALVHRPFVRRLESVVDRVAETTALAVLLASDGLLKERAPHLEALGAWLQSPADAELKARWQVDARPRIVQALRRSTRPLWRRVLRVA